MLVTITDEEWDIAELRASTSLNKSVSDETDIEGGRVSRRGRSAGKYTIALKSPYTKYRCHLWRPLHIENSV